MPRAPGSRASVSLFTNHREALFLRRPNRFLIIAAPAGEAGGEDEIPCHCPNPGRLIEFFGQRPYNIPGARLILEKRPPETARTAKTSWTAGGIYYRDAVVPLYSARANQAAAALILPTIIKDLREIRPEYPLGDSRFDFYCTGQAGDRHLVEVKACTLVEYGTAMFPDAPSSRALKHLEELAALSAQGWRCHLLFVILHGRPRRFIPNLHADPLFAAALHRLGRPGGDTTPPVEIHAALLHTEKNGTTTLAAAHIPVDLSPGSLAEEDRGSYLILLKIPEPQEITIGALGPIPFSPGWYVYTGTAQKNLTPRIKRHQRKTRKQPHWHIDYLTPRAEKIHALPIYTPHNLECQLAAALRHIRGRPIKNFGSTDCHCGSHLIHFEAPPLSNPAFIEVLLRYRHREAFKP